MSGHTRRHPSPAYLLIHIVDFEAYNVGDADKPFVGTVGIGRRAHAGSVHIEWFDPQLGSHACLLSHVGIDEGNDSIDLPPYAYVVSLSIS